MRDTAVQSPKVRSHKFVNSAIIFCKNIHNTYTILSHVSIAHVPYEERDSNIGILSVRRSACLPFCVSVIVLKRLNQSSSKQRCVRAYGSNFYQQRSTWTYGITVTGAPYASAEGQTGDYWPTSRYISETVQGKDMDPMRCIERYHFEWPWMI